MNQKQIFALLFQGTRKPNEHEKMHVRKLVGVFSLLPELEVLNVHKTDAVCTFGRCTEWEYKWGGEWREEERNAGTKIAGAKYAITTLTGNYSFVVPAELVGYVDGLLGLVPAEMVGDNAPTDGECIEVTKGLIKDIKAATKFASKDDLRPGYCAVCFSVRGGNMQVVATDAHLLYMSKKYPCTFADGEYNVPTEQIAAMVSRPMGTLSMAGDSVTLNGLTAKIVGSFPAWRSVVPEHDGEMQVEKRAFVGLIEQVLPTANKVTKAVAFHINGKIDAATCDIDFGLETNASIPYISKTFEDIERVGFNGKFLLKTLGVLGGKVVTFKHDGVRTRPAVLSDGETDILVMPIMLLNS